MSLWRQSFTHSPGPDHYFGTNAAGVIGWWPGSPGAGTGLITSFVNDVDTVEIGSTVNNVTLDWTLSGVVTSQTIPAPGPGAVAPGVETAALVLLGLTTDTTFTLTVGDGIDTDSATTTVHFHHRRRWGVSATAFPDATLIDALAGAEFATDRLQTQTFNPTAQYLYFAWPGTWGVPTFIVNGLVSSGWSKTTVAYTNPSGNTINFDIYRSQFVQNGAGIIVEVQ